MLSALRDELIVPHRAKLVPGFASAQVAAMNAGAKGFGLSGSGPTVLAIVEEASAAAVAHAIEQAFPANPRRFTRVCRLDTVGARLL